MQHPYLDSLFVAAAIALMAIAILATITAWRRFDDHLEDRRERRLDQQVGDQIRAELAAAADNAHIPPQRSS